MNSETAPFDPQFLWGEFVDDKPPSEELEASRQQDKQKLQDLLAEYLHNEQLTSCQTKRSDATSSQRMEMDDNSLLLDEQAADANLRKALADILVKYGFQFSDGDAFDTLTSVSETFLTNLGRTMTVLQRRREQGADCAFTDFVEQSLYENGFWGGVAQLRHFHKQLTQKAATNTGQQ